MREREPKRGKGRREKGNGRRETKKGNGRGVGSRRRKNGKGNKGRGSKGRGGRGRANGMEGKEKGGKGELRRKTCCIFSQSRLISTSTESSTRLLNLRSATIFMSQALSIHGDFIIISIWAAQTSIRWRPSVMLVERETAAQQPVRS